MTDQKRVELTMRNRKSIPTADEWAAGVDTGITRVHRLNNLTAAEHAVQVASQRVVGVGVYMSFISHDDGCPCETGLLPSSSCTCEIVDLVVRKADSDGVEGSNG